MKAFVICLNDYPYCVMPIGSSEDDAIEVQKRLQQENDRKYETEQRQGLLGMKSYYHVREVPVWGTQDK